MEIGSDFGAISGKFGGIDSKPQYWRLCAFSNLLGSYRIQRFRPNMAKSRGLTKIKFVTNKINNLQFDNIHFAAIMARISNHQPWAIILVGDWIYNPSTNLQPFQEWGVFIWVQNPTTNPIIIRGLVRGYDTQPPTLYIY